MTDLTKGIIEIDGASITAATTPSDIKLTGTYVDYIASKNGNVEVFVFKRICLYGTYFDVDVTFINKKLSDIELRSNYEGTVHYEERFKFNCEWLKSILGDPASCADDGNSYYFDGIHIYSFIQRDLSRNPADTHITCSYER